MSNSSYVRTKVERVKYISTEVINREPIRHQKALDREIEDRMSKRWFAPKSREAAIGELKEALSTYGKLTRTGETIYDSCFKQTKYHRVALNFIKMSNMSSDGYVWLNEEDSLILRDWELQLEEVAANEQS
jgi:hypothetical protein